MIENTVYDSNTLLGVMSDNESMQPPSSYWLDLAFPHKVNFTEETIDFNKLAGQRKIAPLVVPTAQGKPIYSAAERVTQVKPAYLKPKDPITGSRVIRSAAGLGELGRAVKMSPMQRYNALVADILKQHRHSIERRWELMAADAVINGQVVLEDEAYPRVVVDFGRDASLTKVLGGGVQWGDVGVSIVSDLEAWRHEVRRAKFGGPTNRLTVGGDVWDVMRQDQELLDLLKTDIRGANGADFNRGLREGADVEFVGRLSGTLDIWVYSDYYEDETGAVVEMMNQRDCVLTGTNIQGVRAFGAIVDKRAGFQPLEIFPKMWDDEDPSGTYIMSQSAPLMVPINPNNTLKASPIG
jgi:hypothetical protein